jgi:hypothetical protein
MYEVSWLDEFGVRVQNSYSEKATCAVIRLNIEIPTKVGVLSPNNVLECWRDEINILTSEWSEKYL